MDACVRAYHKVATGKNHVNDCPPPPDKQHAASAFLSALHRESVLHGAFAWVRRAPNRP